MNVRSHKKYLSSVLIVVLWMIPLVVSGQSIYLHPSHEVYDFLKKMESKQVITDYRDAVKPITRDKIAKFLLMAEERSSLLTAVEREQLKFYEEEFYLELRRYKDAKDLPEERWHLYPYRSGPGQFNVDLVGGYKAEWLPTGKTLQTRSNGIMAYGYVGSVTGIYFYFRDNQDRGTKLDLINMSNIQDDMQQYMRLKRIGLSPEDGQVVSAMSTTSIDYDLMDAQLTFDVASFMSISLEKMSNVWGAGNRGNLIFSTKSPSFPQIKLRMKLGEDADFTYIHGWLDSDLIDSTRSYNVWNYSLPSEPTLYRPISMPKYIAAHMLELTPWKGIDIALGESEVYGGRNPELLYLIPFMLFKAGEHYSTDSDNTQWFGSIDVTAIKNYNIYFTLFLDEFSTSDFYKSDRQRNQLGFTLGGRSFDLFFPNTDLMIEYTRTNPWIYNHKFPDATFQNHTYDLGHWIGQNADLLTINVNYRPMRNLKVGVQFESLRKGGKEPTRYQYLLPTPEFLYGPLIKTQQLGAYGRYEALRDLFIDMNISLNRYTQGDDIPSIFQFPRISPDYSSQVDFFASVHYNFQ